MENEKISRVQPVQPIPPHHLRWCGLAPDDLEHNDKEAQVSTEEKVLLSISMGDLVLYNKKGEVKVHQAESKDEKQSHNNYLLD